MATATAKGTTNTAIMTTTSKAPIIPTATALLILTTEIPPTIRTAVSVENRDQSIGNSVTEVCWAKVKKNLVPALQNADPVVVRVPRQRTLKRMTRTK
jgi:hypothetical protein